MGRSVGLLNSAEGATHPRRSPHSIFISRLKAILGNCQSVMSYVGSLRNEIGDAHDKRGESVRTRMTIAMLPSRLRAGEIPLKMARFSRFFDVSSGLEQVSQGRGDHVDHGREGCDVAIREHGPWRPWNKPLSPSRRASGEVQACDRLADIVHDDAPQPLVGDLHDAGGCQHRHLAHQKQGRLFEQQREAAALAGPAFGSKTRTPLCRRTSGPRERPLVKLSHSALGYFGTRLAQTRRSLHSLADPSLVSGEPKASHMAGIKEWRNQNPRRRQPWRFAAPCSDSAPLAACRT